MTVEDFIWGEIIIKEGDIGECCYILFEGEVNVFVKNQFVAMLRSGVIFGETALDNDERWSATIQAKS